MPSCMRCRAQRRVQPYLQSFLLGLHVCERPRIHSGQEVMCPAAAAASRLQISVLQWTATTHQPRRRLAATSTETAVQELKIAFCCMQHSSSTHLGPLRQGAQPLRSTGRAGTPGAVVAFVHAPGCGSRGRLAAALVPSLSARRQLRHAASARRREEALLGTADKPPAACYPDSDAACSRPEMRPTSHLAKTASGAACRQLPGRAG
jgi:hypothetical protein